MNIAIKHSLEESSDTIVIPVAGPADRQSALEPVAQASGLRIDRLLQDFNAEPGEIHTVYSRENKRFFLLGLGEKPGFRETLKAFRSFSHKWRKKLTPQLSLYLLALLRKENSGILVEAAVNGLCLGAYHIGRFKTENGGKHPLADAAARLILIVDPKVSDVARQAALSGQTVADTQMSVFNLVNAPSNKKLPADLAEWARRSGEKHGYAVRVMDKAEIEKTGLHALLAVNQGSAFDPAFIIMEYHPENPGGRPLKKVGLVGKGVTFDTGGLSIKPSTNMYLMKSDMGGAAAVFGAMEAAARLKLPVHLIGIIPATDNSVDAKAVKPSDVINSYSGKTIEIIDTDAEGRLILADGISYMTNHFKPDVLIDLATLTGSTVRTFGYHAAGLFCNDDILAGQLSASSIQTGERLWRLPLWDVYKEDLKSDVADVRNFSGKPLAGAIGAAKFLEVFTGEHPSWAHLDIAGVVFQDSEFSSQKSATGFGVRLLVDYLKRISE
jgi:leucyl aminopeptidase